MYTEKDVYESSKEHYFCDGNEYVYENGSLYEIIDDRKFLVKHLKERDIKTVIAAIQFC